MSPTGSAVSGVRDGIVAQGESESRYPQTLIPQGADDLTQSPPPQDGVSAKSKKIKTKNKKGSARKKTKFGDEKMVVEDFDSVDDFEKASFREVWQTCCVHSLGEWGRIAAAIILLFICAYFFIVGIELVNASAQVMAGCKAGQIFGEITNPLTALMIGILATAMIHSSGATTAIVVALVEASVLTISQGIYMVMGANIGTTVRSKCINPGAFPFTPCHILLTRCTVH